MQEARLTFLKSGKDASEGKTSIEKKKGSGKTLKP